LFEGSPDAIFVEDLHGVVLDANPAAGRLHDLTREDLIGKKRPGPDSAGQARAGPAGVREAGPG